MKFLKLLITTLIVAAFMGVLYGMVVSEIIMSIVFAILIALLIASVFYLVYMFVDAGFELYEDRRKEKEWIGTWSVIKAEMKKKVEK